MSLAPIVAVPLAIQIHVAAALAAVAAGALQFLLRKSGTRHRLIGWIGVLALGTASISSF